MKKRRRDAVCVLRLAVRSDDRRGRTALCRCPKPVFHHHVGHHVRGRATGRCAGRNPAQGARGGVKRDCRGRPRQPDHPARKQHSRHRCTGWRAAQPRRVGADAGAKARRQIPRDPERAAGRAAGFVERSPLYPARHQPRRAHHGLRRGAADQCAVAVHQQPDHAAFDWALCSQGLRHRTDQGDPAGLPGKDALSGLPVFRRCWRLVVCDRRCLSLGPFVL